MALTHNEGTVNLSVERYDELKQIERTQNERKHTIIIDNGCRGSIEVMTDDEACAQLAKSLAQSEKEAKEYIFSHNNLKTLEKISHEKDHEILGLKTKVHDCETLKKSIEKERNELKKVLRFVAVLSGILLLAVIIKMFFIH